MPPEITRIELVQGDAKALLFHAVRMHPTAGATALASIAGATSWLLMRHQQASNVQATIFGSVVDASAGLIEVKLATANTATPGQYRAQLTIDRGSSIGVETVPVDEPYLVIIKELV